MSVLFFPEWIFTNALEKMTGILFTELVGFLLLSAIVQISIATHSVAAMRALLARERERAKELLLTL